MNQTRSTRIYHFNFSMSKGQLLPNVRFIEQVFFGLFGGITNLDSILHIEQVNCRSCFPHSNGWRCRGIN